LIVTAARICLALTGIDKDFNVLSARGLDIPAIKTVVNFDVSKDIDTHVHRIGRTGRAGEKGTAFTLIVPKNVQFAGDLVRNLVSQQNIPQTPPTPHLYS
jgi:superfamily II DNA/RNA helicase